MLRVDKRTPKEIQDVIVFSQKDAFWMGNILSTKKLWEKFDHLVVNMKQKQQPASGPELDRRLWEGSSYDIDELERMIEGDTL